MANRFADPELTPNAGTTGASPIEFNLRYPGQHFDKESGLFYNMRRSYDKNSGRYTQPDPIGLDGGWNRFAYVDSNPLSFVDPEGLQKSMPRKPTELSVLEGGGGGFGSSGGAYPNCPPASKPSLTAHKDALRQVQNEVGTLPKGVPGKSGSPQAGDSKKGYRLDPPHDGAAKGGPESIHHYNWWDYSGGKRGSGGRSGAVPIED